MSGNLNMKGNIKSNKVYDRFWLNNPAILIDKNRLTEFFPNRDMTRVEQLNAIVRFSFYLSLLLVIYRQNINYLYIGIVSLVLTFAIYKYDPNLKGDEREDMYDIFKRRDPEAQRYNYVKPTYANPFMNPTLLDITENPDRQAYSKKSFVNNYELAQDVEQKFSYNLYQDINDIFGKQNSQRQFYTTPVTTIPNEQTKFAEWLYGRPPSCKDNNGYQCMLNNPRNLDGESPPIIY